MATTLYRGAMAVGPRIDNRGPGRSVRQGFNKPFIGARGRTQLVADSRRVAAVKNKFPSLYHSISEPLISDLSLS